MSRSLQKRLSVMLGAALLGAAVLAGAASFVLAYGEAKEFQDDMLRQIAHLSFMVEGKLPVNKKTAEFLVLADPESRLQLLHLPGDSVPAWFTEQLANGLHTVNGPDGELRVYVFKDGQRRIAAVAQPTEVRDEIALGSALRTLLPLVLLFPLLAFLLIRIVRFELAPIQCLAHQLDAQAADQTRELPKADVPSELLPFVEAINRLLGRVNELVGQQRRFIADAAHELRSPLTALSVQSQNLEKASTLEELLDRVRPLQAGIERSKKLTEQLLCLARTQAGHRERSQVEVTELVRELIADLLPMAEARRIDLGMDATVSLMLPANTDVLRLIVRNGLENALKYSPADTEVTVCIRQEAGEAVIDVVDQGPGIPESERSHVFAPFYRGDGSGAEGSGLGLAIAREAAASLNGSVSLLANASGQGMVFRYRQSLTLPA